MKFDSYHPVINFLYFTTVIICTGCFSHPVLVGISFLCSFLYSVKLGGIRLLYINMLFLMSAPFLVLYYISYHHFGVTVLAVNLIGNNITLEATVAGIIIALKSVAICMWCFCIFKLITTDKIIYLFAAISPKLSIFLVIILRALPRIKSRAAKIYIAREGVGKGVTQGNMKERIMHLVSIISILVTWISEDFYESYKSMKSRGFSLKGRTAYSIYRFENRDRFIVIIFVFCITIIALGTLFNQTTIYFNPVIWINPITYISLIFYVIYTIFLFFPLILQVVTEIKMEVM